MRLVAVSSDPTRTLDVKDVRGLLAVAATKDNQVVVMLDVDHNEADHALVVRIGLVRHAVMAFAQELREAGVGDPRIRAVLYQLVEYAMAGPTGQEVKL